ncbi:MAG TPA: ADOP family duplicated permease, partial [Vicinamibacterales bacterium]|nr:ADOP family duplicated permease [Vicinamibacterales bacterium]
MPFVSAVLRQVMRRQRGSLAASTMIVLTLALALGANTAVFSVADALLVRAVPFREPSRLMAVSMSFPAIRLTGMGLSGPEALELQQFATVFDAVGPYAFSGLTVEGAAGAEQANAVELSAGAAAALGLSAYRGRMFSRDEYDVGGAPVVVLGHAFWRRAFGGDDAIVGRTVRIDGAAREVIGVGAPGVTLLNRAVDMWLPLPLTPGAAGGRADHRFNVVGRLTPGRSLDDASTDLQRAMAIWREETGEMHTPSATMHPLEIQPMTRATTGLSREPIAALVAAVAFVLLIACANISNLLVARAERRRADIAVQLALGASRRRLLIDSLAEGLALAGVGSLGGVALAHGMLAIVIATWPVAANAAPVLDYRVLGMTAAVTLLAGLIIGAVPVLRLDVTRASDALKSGTRGTGASRMRLQKSLVALQIALAVVLSGSAGLMMRSLAALTAVDIGIDADSVLRAHVALPESSYRDDARVWSFYDRLLDRAAALPGVTQAALMSGLPPLRRANNTSFLLDGQESIDHSTIRQVDFVQHISPAYLSVLRIPLLSGRELTVTDNETAAPVALVNESLAERFWPGQNPIGHQLKPAGKGPWFTVVGVVADVRQAGIQSPAGTEIYVAHRQARLLLPGFLPRSMNLVLRVDGDVMSPASALSLQIREMDPTVVVSAITPLQAAIDRTIAQPRLLAWMFAAFAVLALAVAGIGVYAVTSFAANSRTSEFGLRMALGAEPFDALRLLMSSGSAAIGVGLAAG